jgi:hypothetical protein
VQEAALLAISLDTGGKLGSVIFANVTFFPRINSPDTQSLLKFYFISQLFHCNIFKE